MNKMDRTVFFVLIFFFQLAISDYLNLGPFIYICLIPLLILNIPKQISPKTVMLVSFGIGLLFDMMSDGVLGLNAAAAVLTAALRPILYKTIVNEDRQDKTVVPTVKIVGSVIFFRYLSSLMAVYLFAYIIADTAGTRSFWFIAAKIIVSVVVNVALSYLISLSINNRN